MKRRTRIVCTIGPASSSPMVLTRMMRAGMDVARLNFSHGTHDQHRKLLETIRSSAKKAEKYISIIQDLQGPKIRVGVLPDTGIAIHDGESIVFSTAVKTYETNGPIPVTHPSLHKDVKKDDHILLDDGFLEAVITSVRGRSIHAKVTHGGTLKPHKGMNFPDSTIHIESFTEKDYDDLSFGIEHHVDWVVLSFISSPDVAVKVRRLAAAFAKRFRTRTPWIMAKIETKQGIERFDDILKVVDGVMLGRGDLGLEVPMEEVPIIQKDLVEKCRQAGKPIIVATQMLDSMTRNPRATRAEISDVANAVLDHADAVMLSGESANGRYPAATVQAMAAVIDEAEGSRFDAVEISLADVDSPEHAFAHTVGVLAEKEMIDAIVAPITIPDVVECLPRYRPHVPIYVGCEDEDIARRMVLYAGVTPFVLALDAGTFIPRSHALLVRHGILRANDRVVYVTGGGGMLSLTLYRS